ILQVGIERGQPEPWARWRRKTRVHAAGQCSERERRRTVNDLVAGERSFVFQLEAKPRRLNIVGKITPLPFPRLANAFQFLSASAVICYLAFAAWSVAVRRSGSQEGFLFGGRAVGHTGTTSQQRRCSGPQAIRRAP